MRHALIIIAVAYVGPMQPLTSNIV